eukprot:TRINITY_DN2551_c0_g1_i1.p1 TRINITY_DN2551_c0_g1~~TRINITY_DN2551_c0_g1_i1.p1  ORF type:complete len:422 (+),score=79.26 TRINITY_DN2551_c0_g1_i1:114-1268(+)
MAFLQNPLAALRVLVFVTAANLTHAALLRQSSQEHHPKRMRLSDYMDPSESFHALSFARESAQSIRSMAPAAAAPGPGPAASAGPAPMAKQTKTFKKPQKNAVKKLRAVLAPASAVAPTTVATTTTTTTGPLNVLMPALSSGGWKFVQGNYSVAETKVLNAAWAAGIDAASLPRAGSPGPAASPAAAPSSGPAPSPGPSGAGLCSALFNLAGESGKPLNFVKCDELRTSASWQPGDNGELLGCHCGAWAASCPFQTCATQQAWEKGCLDTPATDLGFVALSQSREKLPESALPHPLTRFSEGNPSSVSLCMYWLPDPTPPPQAIPVLPPRPVELEAGAAASPGPAPQPAAAPAPRGSGLAAVVASAPAAGAPAQARVSFSKRRA